jgi:hypothetical protein
MYSATDIRHRGTRDAGVILKPGHNLQINVMVGRGQAVAKWLSHYATFRKVAGSRPDEISEFYDFT